MQNSEEYLTERSENPYSNIFFKYYSKLKKFIFKVFWQICTFDENGLKTNHQTRMSIYKHRSA